MIHIVVHMHTMFTFIMPNETSSGTSTKHATLAEMYRRKREGRARWLTTFALSGYGQVDHLSLFQRRLWAG
jgi:hypothetical protein